MSGPTPLLDFFKRGEVAADVRLLAAQGALAPRAHEQLAILVLLLNDPDPIIRQTAEATIQHIPLAALKAFLARSDVSIDLREFLGDRGIFPDVLPDNAVVSALEEDAPLIDVSTGGPEVESAELADVPGEEGEAARTSLTQQIQRMGFTDRLRAAMKGSREMRAILVRDPNKMIAAAVLSSPRLTDQEVESISRMANVTEDVLRIIGSNRSWMKHYAVVSGLSRNPKTPLALSMNLLARLNDRDIQMLSMDRNVPGTLRVAARKRVLDAASRK